ncbi:family 2 glycosyl transferase [Candidatus Protofrankia californiensis]|uniref:Family 2 glycosyl transferase n=1 Tax=Candidatus Protofrankia californiensis TaxID=1839754 RepID=A0A1C3NXA2_9ACTN|nr:family 2 glycosyl transferase [Candidatus Protofrankia californiensis]
MLHYPTVALTWLMGMLLTFSYMALGSTGVTVHISSWLALYIDVAVARLLLYIWLRRFNISPHEEKGSAGISGIFVSMLCTPFYSTAFVGALLRRPLGFVVTPKGQSASPDRLLTFRKHIFWAAISTASIAAAAVFGHVYPANTVWAALSLLICLTPIVMWSVSTIAAWLRSAGVHGLLPMVVSEQPGIPQQTAAPEQQAAMPDVAAAEVAVPAAAAVAATTTASSSATVPWGEVEEITRVLARPAVLAASAPGGYREEVTQTTVVPALSASAPGGYREEATQTIILPAGLSSLSPGSYVEETTQKLVRPAPVSTPGKPGWRTQNSSAQVGRSAAAAGQPAPGGPAREGPASGAYVEDVTLKLTPRRRRVSGDGLLEELA